MPAARHLVFGLVALAFAGCSLDWAVRSDPGDAGSDAGPDGTIESGIDDRVAQTDTPGFDAGECPALVADLVAKKKKARECQLSQGQCTQSIKDPCDCPFAVAKPVGDKSFTDAYVAAADKLKTSGCPIDCSAACVGQNPQPSWACLQNPDTTFECRDRP